MDYAKFQSHSVLRVSNVLACWLQPEDYSFKSNPINLITADLFLGPIFFVLTWSLNRSPYKWINHELRFLVIDSGIWTSLGGGRGMPVNVQEHSMVFYRDNLYVFGGLFSQPDECPLWIYHTKVPLWKTISKPRWRISSQSSWNIKRMRWGPPKKWPTCLTSPNKNSQISWFTM